MAKKLFEKGSPKPENSGRKKGTPNKRTVEEREAYEAIMLLIEQRMLDGDDVINNLSPARAAELYVNLVGFKKAKLSSNKIEADITSNENKTFTIQYVNSLPKPDIDDIINI